MPSKQGKDKYTDPELRDEVKEEIQEGDKGGAPGQWSARKAQMMASEYKKRGGGYTTDKKDDKAKHLDKWTEEEWQTKEGSGNAKQADGTEKRYLPKKAWEEMSEKEKEETDEKKQEESKEGKQYVANTGKAKQARKDAEEDGESEENEGEQNGSKKNGSKENGKNGTKESTSKQKSSPKKDDAKDASEENGEKDSNAESSAASEDEAHPDATTHGKKRGRGANAPDPAPAADSNKKQKKSGSSDEPRGSAGDKTRVPKEGQTVQWHALPGYVEGEVVEVVYEEKTVEGKQVKGSKEDPRIVLKSSSSGKIAVHKPEAVYFE